MSVRNRKGGRSDPPGHRRRWSTVDLLLIGLYAVVAIVIVLGLVLFMIWGTFRD
jgi:nitrate reductase NapE component